MRLALLFASVVSLTSLLACPTRECEGFNDCPAGSFCTTDFVCEQELAPPPEPEPEGSPSVEPAPTPDPDAPPAGCPLDPERVYILGQYGFETPRAHAIARVDQPTSGCVGFYQGPSQLRVTPSGGLKYIRANLGGTLLEWVPDQLLEGPSGANGWQYDNAAFEGDDLEVSTGCADGVDELRLVPGSGAIRYRCRREVEWRDESGASLNLDDLDDIFAFSGDGHALGTINSRRVLHLRVAPAGGAPVEVTTGDETAGLNLRAARDDGQAFVVAFEHDDGHFERWRIGYDASATREGTYAALPPDNGGPDFDGEEIVLDGAGDVWFRVRSAYDTGNGAVVRLGMQDSAIEYTETEIGGPAESWRRRQQPYVGGTILDVFTGP